jgi:hypothetical protein
MVENHKYLADKQARDMVKRLFAVAEILHSASAIDIQKEWEETTPLEKTSLPQPEVCSI